MTTTHYGFIRRIISSMHFNALRIIQPSGRHVYAFATIAGIVLKIADIQRIGRGEHEQLIGYQRPELAGHISEIRRYIEESDAVLPNTIVIAFDDSVQFIPLTPSDVDTTSEYGILQVPDYDEDTKRPGFIVDGQQRLAAIASCCHTDFPVFVTAMIAPSIKEQRKQFVLVNRTKPLPQEMVFELLPEIDGVLPQHLSRQRLAAKITSCLNLQQDSYLYHKIKTPTCPAGYIKDNSIRRLVLNSLSDGILFMLLQQEKEEARFVDAAVALVSTFWEGVSITFGEACDLPPNRSRLTHGVGIISLGYVMDHIFTTYPQWDGWTAETIATALEPLSKYCAWTDGFWVFNGSTKRRWNELQNIDRDIRLLTNHFRRLLQQPRLLGLS